MTLTNAISNAAAFGQLLPTTSVVLAAVRHGVEPSSKKVENRLTIKSKLLSASTEKPLATICLLEPFQALVADWQRGCFYHVELEILTDAVPKFKDSGAIQLFFAKWQAWRTNWAHRKDELLTDPEMAAALRGLQAVAEQWIGLRRVQYRVTGKRLT